MASVLSLDDGRWLSPAENPCPPLTNEARNDHFPLGIIRQPSPPPVLAQVQPECIPIPPSRVADPRPGPLKQFQDGTSSSNSYQHLHIVSHPFWCYRCKSLDFPPHFLRNFWYCQQFTVLLFNCVACVVKIIGHWFFVTYLQPMKMMEDFLRLAQENTAKNLETCGVLAGSLVQSVRAQLFFFCYPF